MLKRSLLLAAAAALVATSVGISRTQAAGEVNIVAWAGYIERGETDKNFDWVTGFETETGCKVNVQTAGTSDEMVALMNEGNYDLVTASGDASLRLIAGKRVQPVDLSKVPSYAKVDKRLQGAPWYTVDGKSYGVPYQWGANVLAYNTNVFKEAPTSWSVVFEEQTLPDGKSNKGRVQAYDGAIYIADAALYLKTKNPELKITDPYSLDEKQYAAALELLRGQRKIVTRYWHDVTVQITDFTSEGVVASGTWPFQVNLLQADKQPIASTIPVEGATGWADTTMLGSESANLDCAYKWLEHSLNPKLQGDLAAWFGSVPAVPDACNGNDLLGKEGCATNGFESFDKISFWRTPETKCGDARGDVCIPYRKWQTDYIGVIGGR